MFDTNSDFDTIVLMHLDNRFFYTNLDTSFGVVILNAKGNVFITDSRYAGFARQNAKGFEVVIMQQGDEVYSLIAECCKKLGAKRIGYEEFGISKLAYDKLSSACDGQLVGVGKYLDDQRAIKQEYMIANMSKAQQIAETALETVRTNLKVGMTEREVANELLFDMMRQGATGASFDTIVAFGENSAYPHHAPTDRRLQKDDIILVDMGAKYKGFCSDMTRTFCIGKLNAKLEDIYKAVLQAQTVAIEGIKAGVSCKDIDSVAREYLKGRGYGEQFVHSLGHGVGVAVHENPRLSPTSQDTLKQGMVVTVEPGVYVEGLGGVRIEDMVLVQKDGIVNFAKYAK